MLLTIHAIHLYHSTNNLRLSNSIIVYYFHDVWHRYQRQGWGSFLPAEVGISTLDQGDLCTLYRLELPQCGQEVVVVLVLHVLCLKEKNKL